MNEMTLFLFQACSLDWSDYPIPGVTFGCNSHYLSPFAVFTLRQDETNQQHSQVGKEISIHKLN